MDSIRKWFYRPKREDKSLLAQFFYADESLNGVACELDSFDGRQEPERCTTLVNQLRHCQDKVLTICNQIMDELIPEARANRDFRVKFPDDVMQENLAGQLWFGAECLAAGSSILNREAESSAMRPLAKALTKSLEIVRNLLREQVFKGQTSIKAQNPLEPTTEKLIESLKIFDRLFADFELCYVGAMVPVKSTKEYEQQELVCVLFSETLQRALERSLLSQADVDNYEPALMFTIPRLAIVAGLLAPPGGPLCLNSVDTISEMFRPFRSLLLKIRELLWTLNNRELYMLEKLLCSIEEASTPMTQASRSTCQDVPDLEEFVYNFYTGYPNCKEFIADFYTVTRNNGSNVDEVANDAVLILEQDNSERVSTSAERKNSPETDNEVLVQPSESSPSHGMNQDDSSVSRAPTLRHDSSGSSDFYSCDSVSVEIPQTQYLLNQVSHESNAPVQRIEIPSSLPDIDSRKLISEANKNLSNLLLETNCQNEMSEQMDSGICTVISSENTSLYDKSPEEKKSFVKEEDENPEEEGNTPYFCSHLSSGKPRSSDTSENSCVCSGRGPRTSVYLKPSLESCKQNSRSEQIIGIAYGNGQIPVCEGNQPGFQINYTENWERLNLKIEASSSRRAFWRELSQETTANRKRKEEKQRRRRRHHRRKCETPSEQPPRKQQQHHRVIGQLPTSSESSRSNSADRCLKPRLLGFGPSLHPSQNTRQMPKFGGCSPHASPRMQHFECRGPNSSKAPNAAAQQQSVSQSKKLLEHRRSRSEQLQRLKRRERAAYKLEHFRRRNNCSDLINDGLGPRTNKSGVVVSVHLNSLALDASTGGTRVELASSSSCSSCCDSSSETSEFQSDCQDDEEIALAMQAAEIANRNQIRAKFRSSEDLVHRLFVCIAGVADQLQTNFASDLRNILKCVFLMNSSQTTNEDEKIEEQPPVPQIELNMPSSSNESLERQESIEDEELADDHETTEERSSPVTERGEECVERAPIWVPDSVAPRCMACQAGFTVVRRRHHCRNCGKVFCGRCSGNNVPLPRYGHTKPVRVCNRCFLYQLFADGSGSTQPLYLASWINNTVTVDNVNLFPEKLNKGFMGHRLLVSTIQNPPFTIRRSLIDSDETDWDGIEIRLLKLSATYLNFTIEFTESRSSAQSAMDSIKYDLLNGITSAATGGIYQTAELLKSFDTVTPFSEDCAAFISLASTAIPKYRAILGPFQLSVWLLLCAAYLALIVPLTFNSNYSVLALLKHPSNLSTMFWFVYSTYTNSFVIKSPLLNHGIAKNSIALLLAIYWVFTIIVTACYTSSIVAFITLPVYPSAIETANELLTYRYRIGTLAQNGWEKWFNVNTTDDPFLGKLFRKMEYVPSVLEGVQNASRAYFWPYAFLASKTTLEYIIQTDFAPTWTTKRSLMHVSNECFVRYNVAQLFPAKSLYTKYMNIFINRATETGLIDKIISDIDWIIQRIAKKTNKQITKRMSRRIQVEDRILTVEDTQGMFLILGAGILIAVFALSTESLANFIKKCQENEEDISTDVSSAKLSQRDSWVVRKDSHYPGIRRIPNRGSI